MKVYVTQGHEKGIGLEVFFKACLFLPKKDLHLLKLIAYKKTVEDSLLSLNLPFRLNDHSVEVGGISVDCTWLNDVNVSQSFTALNLGMKLSEGSGILYTLPTSKDQFPAHAGHTEYFREFYRRPDLGMFFSSGSMQLLLLTDHVAVNKLSELMTTELIFRRIRTAIETLQKWKWPTERILVAGLNPHAGEGGIIGSEDQRIKMVIKRLSDEFKFNVSGPYPGDTMLIEQKSSRDLLVYMFHDQGLGVFKGLQGFTGSNITLGLPYPRFSPDHGTSFSLFGKNQADYRGCEFSLKQAVKMLKKVTNGKNTSN